MIRLHLPYGPVEMRAVGLDVDGVLRDTGYTTYRALCATITELGGKPPEYPDFVRYYGIESSLGFYQACGVRDASKILDVYRKHLGTIEDSVPYEDVAGFLGHVWNLGLEVFIVSGHPTAALHSWFERHGVSDHFVSVYGGSSKKADCMRNACEGIGVDPMYACFAGDLGLDMHAANAVGLTAIGVARGYETHEALRAAGAAHVVDHLSELAQLLG